MMDYVFIAMKKFFKGGGRAFRRRHVVRCIHYKYEFSNYNPIIRTTGCVIILMAICYGCLSQIHQYQLGNCIICLIAILQL